MRESIFYQRMNDPSADRRLEALREAQAQLTLSEAGIDVNNHIHTTFSFSPYSPTLALWKAREAGLCTAGIMDHDSVGGVREFIRAGKILEVPTTIGVECRVSFAGTPLEGRRINNTDQDSIAYVTLHGIPHDQIDTVEAFLAPLRAYRGKRNEAMVKRLDEMFAPLGIRLDYSKDVLPLSQAAHGGSVTERHILYALALKIINHCGKGDAVIALLQNKLSLPLGEKIIAQLRDVDNPFYDYDLLGGLKSFLVEQFYINATDECPPVSEFIDLAKRTGGIACYAYLGDVGDSVTGDKRTQKFEDDYLDLLFDTIKDLGFMSVTYMPSRNTMAQLDRLRAMCDQYGFFQISGEDINSPRQSFICMQLREDKFANLREATWALIAHELLASIDPARAFFSQETMAMYPSLAERTAVYAAIGQEMAKSGLGI